MMPRMPSWGDDRGFPPYVPVAERRAKALLQAKKLEKRGRKLDPVRVAGTRIASSFWGKAWCTNLESYSDLSNRLPRGRTYLRTGAVIDLKIAAGRVNALVAGTSLYEVSVRMRRLPMKRWKGVISSCTGHVDSAIELLSGRVPETVLRALVDRKAGLFPAPAEIEFDCSCPDFAGMCKHIAAVLYGVGARLDRSPELFFTLRKLDLNDLVAGSVPTAAPSDLDGASLEGIFGIELDREERRPAPGKPARRRA
jgi:uncharacterized Zn finger protein